MSVCEIVQTGPSHRLPRGSDEASVTCPMCGSSWTTSERNRRRILAGEIAGTCKGCKRPALRVTESHRRYWLVQFGCELKGRTAEQYVIEEGLPPELALIAEELEDSMPRSAAA